MIKQEAFLALETSLVTRLQASFKPLTDGLYATIGKLLSEKEFDNAIAEVQSLSLNDVYVDNERYIEYVSHLAMLFGASRVTTKPGTSVVGLGFERPMVHQAMQTLQISFGRKAEDYLKVQALQLIAQKRLADQPVEKAESQRAVLPFASFMKEATKSYFNTASSLHTSRLSSYGFVAEADALNVTEYEINEQLDIHICPVCYVLHKKRFKVKDARGILDIVVRTQDPDQLKSLTPWPSQSKAAVEALREMSIEEIVARNWHIPPYHPRCRGLLSKVGKAPLLSASGGFQSAPASSYAPSREEFDALGVSITKDQLSKWAELVGSSPSQVIAKLLGTTQDQLLASLPIGSATKIKNSYGLKTLTINDAVSLKLNAPIFGSINTVEQALSFSKNALSLDALKIAGAAPPSVIKPYLKTLIATAGDVGVESVAIRAGSSITGYDLAKAGFTITAEGWATLKKKILKQMVLAGKTALQVQAFNAIMESDDPKSLFELVNVSGIGKQALAGHSWTGILDLTSTEAMERFHLYLGKAKYLNI